MRQFFITVLGVIVGGIALFMLLFFALIGAGAALSSAGSEPDISGDTVLTLDLRQSVMDHSAGDPLLGSAPLSTVSLVRSLDRAKSDDNIKGLLIRAGGSMAPASAEEIRIALNDFRDSGKFVMVHAQGFENTSILPYMAVSAADEIWQQATTGFAVAGLRSETGFYGGIFEKFDVKAEFEQFHEYKSAANVYTQSDFTDAHRESTTSFLTSIYDIAIAGIAEDRDMSIAAVTAYFNAAPHSAESALEAGLIDKLGHYIDAENAAKTKAGGDTTDLTSIKSYAPAPSPKGPVIAFIGGQGPIMLGGSQDGSNPFSSAVTMGGDSVSKALIKASKDKKVKAIVFRVSSPGGSATASDQIQNAVKIAQDAGKPVVISMGQYAASGGYYVSAGADSIVAMPSTITGSIGVLGGKLALRDAYAKVGYNVEAINIGGDYLGVYSGDEPFTEAQRKGFHDQMEAIYIDFTELVADGRDIPIERVREIAKGRVWTGAQAKEIGLVDEFGGIMKAIDIAKDLAGIDADKTINLTQFPRPKTTAEQFEDLFSASADLKSDIEVLRALANLPEVQEIIKGRKNFGSFLPETGEAQEMHLKSKISNFN